MGGAGLLAFAATAGLVDVDAVTLAVSGLVSQEGLEPGLAGAAVLVAAGVDTASKAGLAALFGRRLFAGVFILASAATLAAGAAALVVLM
jgi:uncharacterized membrane protein (DUF4010 family)